MFEPGTAAISGTFVNERYTFDPIKAFRPVRGFQTGHLIIPTGT
jgi:hypothetical protein